MVKKREILAIIPARGGSKSIPRKNIKPFCGIPLLAWSIAAARQSKFVTRIIVSTDDEEIAAIARKFGAETPFLRPAKYSRDNSRDIELFVHALKWLEKHENYKPDLVIQLRPTSPIRPKGIVDKAVKILLKNKNADSVRGVVPAGQNPHKMWLLKNQNSPMKNLLNVKGIKEPYNAPRQTLPQIYWQTGHIDVIRPKIILKGSMSGKIIYPLIVDPSFTVDIDNLRDWARYEHTVATAGLDMVWVEKAKRPRSKSIQLIVSDFDGVITDNRVWTNQNGRELVSASRSDSLRINDLKEQGIEFVILSSEVNPVVGARAKKMGVEFVQGVDVRDKGKILKKLLAKKKVDPAKVIYIGNDINDLPCFEVVGWAVAVADAYPEVLQAADHVLTHTGGHGAIRELCDMVLSGAR